MATLAVDILFVDDDKYYTDQMSSLLAHRAKFSVHKAYTVRDAITAAETMQFRLVIMDVRMDPGSVFDHIETAGGHKTGVALARELKNRLPGVKMLVNTGSADHDLEIWFANDPGVSFLAKSPEPEQFLRTVSALLNPGLHHYKAFIVHGRDRYPLFELRQFLTRLGFDEPMVLSDLPSRGLTLIEKFEHYASLADVVFVLMTPDDYAGPVDHSDPKAMRARQNVIFEMGYFLGSLRRRSGRVFLLHKGELDIPSDIKGLVYVDISNGVDSAGESLRRELSILS